jgi:hypothetical protein
MSHVSASHKRSPRGLSTAALVKEINAEVSNLAHQQLELAMTEVKAALKREAAAAGLSNGAGVGIWQWRVHVRQRDSWLSRAQRLSPAAHCAIQAPNDVAKTSPSVARRIATTVAVAAAGMLARRFLTQYPSQFTHAQAERIGSRSGRRNSDQTARSSEQV